MKTVLVFFNNVSKNKRNSTGYTSYRVAKRLLDTDSLAKVFCLDCDRNVDIPEKYLVRFLDNLFVKGLFIILNLAQRLFPSFNARFYKEIIFDLLTSMNINENSGALLFCSRPLFLRTVKKAKALGMNSWIQSSVPHPLFNYAMVKNEEIRFQVKSQGSYSNLKRALKISNVIAESDKLISCDPAIGEFTYNSYVNFIGPQKIITLRNYFSVDQAEYNSNTWENPTDTNNEITFLHVSHMNLIKGIPYLLDAWHLLQRKVSVKCKLLLVGKADHNIRKIYRDRYIHIPNIEFRGFVKDLVSCYEEGDVFISPSISDAGPAAILEAMAAGLPIIASTNCGFASLIVDGQEGYTYPYNDVERLAEIMYGFVQNVSEIERLGNNARKKIETFSIDRYAEEVCEKIKEYCEVSNS